MQPITKRITGEGFSPWQSVSTDMTPFNVSVACVVTGTVDYTLQYTYDPLEHVVTTFDDADISAESTNQAKAFNAPVTGFRLKGNSGSAGTVVMTVLQAGIAGNR